MEVILEVFFENVLENLDRGCLMARYKRKQMVDYFTTVMLGCASAENCSEQDACKRAIECVLKFHDDAKMKNKNVCLLGKYHNFLYVATKLCYDWNLDDTETVVKLLKTIYECEKTFEKLFEGAILGTKVTQLISGWKSDYSSRKENIQAMEYFLIHATKAKLVFKNHGVDRRFIDVCMDSYGCSTPARVTVTAGHYDVLNLLLKYGATVTIAQTNRDYTKFCLFQPVINKLNYSSCNNLPYPVETIRCLESLLKIHPYVPEPDMFVLDDNEKMPEICEDLVVDNVLPNNPFPLQYLCRCAVWNHLRECYELPFGIDKLDIPRSIQEYLHINFEHVCEQKCTNSNVTKIMVS